MGVTPSLRERSSCAYNASQPEALAEALSGCENLVISVGTSAFPSGAWANGNTPRAACFDSVRTILDAVSLLGPNVIKKVAMVSSAGVDRRDIFPFKVLNLCQVLTAKKDAEDLLLARADRLGYLPIICRPGRLVGPPFTNNDLTRLLAKQQDPEMRGLVLDRRDVLAGDVDRSDVAESIVRLLLAEDVAEREVVYSIVNGPGAGLSAGTAAAADVCWTKLLTLFTVSQEDMLTTRRS
eukprot:scaffold3045_cov179-Ochromonas_danica.AAC.14